MWVGGECDEKVPIHAAHYAIHERGMQWCVCLMAALRKTVDSATERLGVATFFWTQLHQTEEPFVMPRPVDRLHYNNQSRF
jgi:hypothetical protein